MECEFSWVSFYKICESFKLVCNGKVVEDYHLVIFYIFYFNKIIPILFLGSAITFQDHVILLG